jgi:thiosulfate dehydrogenase [quinone] large subunit
MNGAAKAGGPYGTFQLTALVSLRILIGWHFFYEGLAKITNPYWTSAGYLQESQGWFSGFFVNLSASPGTQTVVDVLNQWGLLLIGLALILGVFVRTASWAGVAILALYYLAAPPFPGMEYGIPAEGSYLIVNKLLIELAAFLVILGFPTAHLFGLEQFFGKKETDQIGGQGVAAEEGS